MTTQSPEIFLNDDNFRKIYHSDWFQNQLIFKVVDKAHMVYTWGLVQSKKAKNYSFAHKSMQDTGSFRPSYGNLFLQLTATEQAPLLLMSATCPPKHLDAILENLKIKRKDIDILRGELTRPEITYIRVDMKKSKNSLENLKNHFDLKVHIPDSEVFPTLIYTSTRHATMQALVVAKQARGTPGDELNAESSFGRRYHSCTGPEDKIDRNQDFSEGKFQACACTNALGLGQNWTRVRKVVQVGRGSPPHISQITGRCGRNGLPGLAIIYIEKTRKGGKNEISEFADVENWTDDDKLDAFAKTLVCIQIVLNLSNTYVHLNPGYSELIDEDILIS